MQARRSSLLFLALASAVSLSPEALQAAPRYKMVLDAATPEHGVKTVSLVANPAIQRGWVALAASPGQKLYHLSTATEGPQKQVLTGPALLPGQEILRLDAAGNPFYITFDEQTIEATARQFAAQARHTSTNQDHSVALAGNVVYESWLVADPANDKASALGLDVPAGTWMLSIHIPDEQYWLSEVVTGNKTGFSIEGLFDSQQLDLSAVAPAPQPVKKNWVSAVLAAVKGLGSKEASAVTLALGLEQLADGRAIQIDDVSGAVTLATGEALPDGEYDLLNGGKLVVAAGKKADGEGQPATANNPVAPVVAAGATPPEVAPHGAPAAGAAAPTPLEATATPEQIVQAINGLIAWAKKDQAEDAAEAKTPPANPATAPAAQKMAAQLHGVAVEKLGDLKLDAIELDGGDTLTLNPVSKKLTDSKGALVESGYYKAADGSYFQVSTDQWFWSIDKQTYDAVYAAKLQAVELADVKAKLAAAPGGKVIKLHGETAEGEGLTPGQLRLAEARARNKK